MRKYGCLVSDASKAHQRQIKFIPQCMYIPYSGYFSRGNIFVKVVIFAISWKKFCGFGRAHARSTRRGLRFFVCKYFVVRLSTTKTTKILPLEKYPLYGIPHTVVQNIIIIIIIIITNCKCDTHSTRIYIITPPPPHTHTHTQYQTTLRCRKQRRTENNFPWWMRYK